MDDYSKLSASDGTGEAVVANVENDRAPAAATLDVDNVDNWPTNFICVTGTLNPNNYIDNASMTIFYGHIDAGNIIIDSFAPGYADVGNTAGQIAIIKPTSEWVNQVVELALVSHDDDGKLKVDAPVTGGGDLRALLPPGAIIDYAGTTAPAGYLLCFGQAVSRATYSALFEAIVPSLGTFTITIAAPGVVTKTAHGLVTGDQIYFTTTGALPTGLAINTLYYVIYVDANSFRLATSRANALVPTPITTTGSQSGVHTIRSCPHGLGDGTTTFNIPDARGRVVAGADAMGGTAAARLNLQRSQGSYGQHGASGGAQAHVIVTAELAAHTHNSNKNHGTSGSAGVVDSATASSSGTWTTGSAGSDTAHNNVQPTLVTNKIIKT